jgi:hypothetical protein
MAHRSLFSNPLLSFSGGVGNSPFPAIAVHKKTGGIARFALGRGTRRGGCFFSCPCQPSWLVEASDDSPYSRFPPPRPRLYGLRGGLSAAGLTGATCCPASSSLPCYWSPAQQRTRPFPICCASPSHDHFGQPREIYRFSSPVEPSSFFRPTPFCWKLAQLSKSATTLWDIPSFAHTIPGWPSSKK